MEKTPLHHSKDKRTRPRWRFLISALIFVFACNFTGRTSTESSPGPGNLSTAAALTVQAQLTKGALNIEVTNTQTPQPKNTGTSTPAPIEASETPALPPPDSCGDSLPTRLSVDSEATVVVFQITLRTEPGLNAEQVNFLARDRVVQVLNGPQCVDGSWWWQINSEELGFGGWVVEGDKDNYYLDP